MPVNPSLTIEGGAELRKALRYIGDAGLKKELRVANLDAAQVVAKEARPPQRSGALAQTVKALGSQTSGQVKAGTGKVGYAAAIHFGRNVGNVGRPPGNKKGPNRIAGRPFLWEAAEKSMSRVVSTYGKAIDRLLDQIRGT